MLTLFLWITRQHMHVIVVAVAKMIITANIPPLPAAIKIVSISAADMSVLSITQHQQLKMLLHGALTFSWVKFSHSYGWSNCDWWCHSYDPKSIHTYAFTAGSRHRWPMGCGGCAYIEAIILALSVYWIMLTIHNINTIVWTDN